MNLKPLLFALLLVNVVFSQQLQSPSEFLGYELGSEFTRHHEVKAYFEYLQKENPDRVTLEVYGYTYERRPLLFVTLSSKENNTNLERIRKSHLESTSGVSTNDKAIVWLSYNVHGNESVSTEASMQTAYDLLTTKTAYLEDAVVIIDPCVNPDGRERYVNFYYENKNTPYQVDPNSKEHHEGWLSGRSNHYMFDLNRDWAWLTQVESQERIKKYNAWLPHIHVDFHEQGVNEPYYFAPAAKPYHSVITDFQRDFQTEIGKNHAGYFDSNKWFYFTKEVFDLFYPSYGDTYPTYNGSVGMTYEQGGSGRAGLGIKTSIGDTLTLKERIAHHHTTGLSTVEVAAKHSKQLNTEFAKFYANTNHTYANYVVYGEDDKLSNLAALLDQHNIEYGVTTSTSVKGFDYLTNETKTINLPASNLVVTTKQTKGTLVDVLFEPNPKLEDSLTYDITSWSMPYAHGLNAVATNAAVSKTAANKSITNTKVSANAYAYVTDWTSFKDAKFLAYLIKNNIRVRYSELPFTIQGASFNRGSLIITQADNRDTQHLISVVNAAAEHFNKSVLSVSTGFVEKGVDFGSSSVKMVPNKNVAIVSGASISTLQFGEVWHFFEQQLKYPVSVIDMDYINRIDLSDYQVLIVPHSYGNLFDEKQLNAIAAWVQSGGSFIVMGNTIANLEGSKQYAIEFNSIKKDTLKQKIPHEDLSRHDISDEITGAIFKTKVDNTHPLAYGYSDSYFTLKLGDMSLKHFEQGSVVYLEEDTKPVSGFAGHNAQQAIKNSLVFGVQAKGRGQVIYMVDNPLFRAFWENGKLFFANAIFMVN